MAERCVPVSVDTMSEETSILRRLWAARTNLLSVWAERDYRVSSINFKALNQQYFVCNSPALVKRVFLLEHDNYDRKAPQMRHALEPLLGDGLFVSDGELWKERREHCAPAFEAELLPGFADVMSESAMEVVDRWRQLPDGASVDMLNEMARLTARIIGRTVFGDDTTDEEAAQVVEGFSEYQRQVEQIEISDALGLPFLRYFVNPLRRLRSRRSGAKVHAVIDRIIENRRKYSNSGRFTLLSLLLEGDTGKPGAAKRCPLGATAARNEAIVMFMAGHETTANSLAWTWYLLDLCPDVMEKMQAEIDQVLGGRAPRFEDVDKLHYTQAVFEEAMRLYPPVPVLNRQSRNEDEVDGTKIEAGAIILVVPWLLGRHEEYWDDPNAFRPERFLPGQPKPDKFVYLPFSVGKRVCLGKRFGLTEGVLCLATLAQHFTPKLHPGHKVEIECRLTLRPSGGLPMTLQKRRT